VLQEDLDVAEAAAIDMTQESVLKGSAGFSCECSASGRFEEGETVEVGMLLRAQFDPAEFQTDVRGGMLKIESMGINLVKERGDSFFVIFENNELAHSARAFQHRKRAIVQFVKEGRVGGIDHGDGQ
jgi:hypothetical protein